MEQGRKTRVPKLKQDDSGRYYCAYRDDQGKVQRERYTRDENESQILHAAFITRRYGSDHVDPSVPVPVLHDAQTSLLTIGIAYLDDQHKRRRKEGEPRKPDTISTRQYYNIEIEVDSIVDWAKAKHGEMAVRKIPFAKLWTLQAYTEMMQEFTRKYSLSQINKRRIRFWSLAKFARGSGYGQTLPFTNEEVRRFGGKEKPKAWVFPSPTILQKLLRQADTRMRCWIWMALGMGFGPGDLCVCEPRNFDAEDFNMTRPKSPGIYRYGRMRPMTWAWMTKYLTEQPRKPDELMFVNANGVAFNRDEDKTEEELKYGTATHKNKPIIYKHTDGIGKKWRELKSKADVEFEGGFYLLRHIACTAFAKRAGVTPADLVTFMGHARLEEMKKYLMPLTPQNKPAVAWVNAMLDCADSTAWELDPDKVLATLQQGGSVDQLLAQQRGSAKPSSRARRHRKGGTQQPDNHKHPAA